MNYRLNPIMRSCRHWIAGGFIAALLFVGASFALSQPRTSAALAGLTVRAKTIDAFDNRDPSRMRFGALEFRGGLVLTADSPAFGGISALHMEADGAHFLAATDMGSWLRGRIVYRAGRPAGIADAEMAPMLDAAGRPLSAHIRFDSESLVERDGFAYVGAERQERIVRFDLRHHGLRAHAESVAVPAEFKTFTKNKSLECLAAPPKGAPLAEQLIVVTEHILDNAGNFRSYLLKDGATGHFSVRRHGNFDVSDCTVLPSGDLLLLERSFSLFSGLGMRIRRIPLGTIKPGALVDGPVLITADLGDQIDNMEGIGAHRNAEGEIILTLVSDDNFSPIQRNLLLQFKLVEE
jgi:hypothetical protein